MRGKQSGPDASEIIWASIPDVNLRNGLNGRMLGQEYDGLESAELAWIMGRRFITKAIPAGSADLAAGGSGAPVSNEGMQLMNASAHGLGVGYGPDRMQRLAYQGYVEAYFRAVFGSRVVKLSSLQMCDAVNTYLVADLKKYHGLIGSSTVLNAVDVPFVSKRTFGVGAAPVPLPADKQVQYKTRVFDAADKTYSAAADVPGPATRGGAGRSGLNSGIFVMDKGPFLRGKIVDDSVVDMPDPYQARSPAHPVERNLGDNLAFEALYAHMRANSFFDWQPDGMVLSKLESPAGDTYGSMELDARQAQLFNIAIQGPAIAKTWTGDYKMQTMPMDKVFIAIVADVVTEVGAPTAGANFPALWDAFKDFQTDPTVDMAAAKAAATIGGTQNDPGASAGYFTALKELFTTYSIAQNAGTKELRDQAELVVTAARNTIDSFFQTGGDATWLADWEVVAGRLRRGELGETYSGMTNFRLKRVTSSYLTQYSHFRQGDANSRCGLKIGTKDGANLPAGGGVVAGEYIIGAWCIGTVLDNSASRSTIGSTVRVAPASMAININVNIEWWSGDKLYKNYMDVDGQVLRRDMSVEEKHKPARQDGVDVSDADTHEKKSWF